MEGCALWDRRGPIDARLRNAALTAADVDAEHAQRVRDLVAAHLRAIFPDALFLHVIRDPRAVVASLLAVHWWPDLPLWWSDDRTPRALAADGSKPEAVAAEHWVRSVERLLADSRPLQPTRYLEIRYEEFSESPEAVLSRVDAFAGLSSSPRLAESVRRRGVTSQNDKYRSQFEDEELRIVERIVAPVATRLGYRVEPDNRLGNGHVDHQECPRPVTRD